MTSPPMPDPTDPKIVDAVVRAARHMGSAGVGAGVAKLLAVLYDPDTSLVTVSACLGVEPALAARVLKVSNSPYYGLAGRVGTIEGAVRLLGLDAVRGIAATGCLDRLPAPRAGSAFEPGRFRRHGIAVAWAAQQASSLAGAGVDGEAFMAGLLHDIGVLVLARMDPARMAAFEPLSRETAIAAAAAGLRRASDVAAAHEHGHFGVTHSAVGAVLAGTWALPDWLCDALAGHHSSGSGSPSRGLPALPALLSFADHAADSAGLGLWPACGLDLDGYEALSAALPPDAFDRIVAGLPDAVLHLMPDA